MYTFQDHNIRKGEKQEHLIHLGKEIQEEVAANIILHPIYIHITHSKPSE